MAVNTETPTLTKRSGATPRKSTATSAQNNIDSISEVLEPYSIEQLVDIKLEKFFDQLGTFYPENVHESVMSKVEKVLIRQVLKRSGGNQLQASKILGVNRNTLRKKMRMYGLQP